MESPFKQAIKEHLVLRAQNTVLEAEMPLARYRSEEISANHAVFKSEAMAVQEETREGAQADWPAVAADTGGWQAMSYGRAHPLSSGETKPDPRFG